MTKAKAKRKFKDGGQKIMKACFCPNCGTRQRFKIDVSSKVAENCPECGRSLLAKRDQKSITVSAQDPTGSEQTITVKATEVIGHQPA
jgi:hypothetical protein